MTFTRTPPRKKYTALKVGGIAIGGFVFLLVWLVGVAASLAVPALAIWAILHFALHWV